MFCVIFNHSPAVSCSFQTYCSLLGAVCCSKFLLGPVTSSSVRSAVRVDEYNALLSSFTVKLLRNICMSFLF